MPRLFASEPERLAPQLVDLEDAQPPPIVVPPLEPLPPPIRTYLYREIEGNRDAILDELAEAETPGPIEVVVTPGDRVDLKMLQGLANQADRDVKLEMAEMADG